MKSQIRIAFVLLVLCSIFLPMCTASAPQPAHVVETQIVVADSAGGSRRDRYACAASGEVKVAAHRQTG